MSESSHLGTGPMPYGLESVEWLPSGAHSGMLRVQGTRSAGVDDGFQAPMLMLRAGAEVHSFDSLRGADSGAGRWRAAYVLASELLSRSQELWLAWADGGRVLLPPVETEVEYATSDAPAVPEPRGEVIDRAVMAERRAQRAETAAQTQARATADALAGLSALERRLEEVTAERDRLAARSPQSPDSGAGASAIRLVEDDDAAVRTPLEDLHGELEAARAAHSAAERAGRRRPAPVADRRSPLEAEDTGVGGRRRRRPRRRARVRARILASADRRAPRGGPCAE